MTPRVTERTPSFLADRSFPADRSVPADRSFEADRSSLTHWSSVAHRWSMVPAHRPSPARRRFSPLLAARDRWRTHPHPSAARGRRGIPGPVSVSPTRTTAAPHRTPVPTSARPTSRAIRERRSPR
jgi:hypothetical protein